MTPKKEKPHETRELPEPNLTDISCPTCKSVNIKRTNSYLRKIKDLGTKTVRKFVEFESIHLKCNSCHDVFPLEREGIVPGLSATKDVLDSVLLLYFDFKHSAKTVVKLMNSLYSVKLKRGTILKWIRTHGKEYCEKNQIVFQENFEKTSGHLGMDGTFPRFNFDEEDFSSLGVSEKKTQVPLVYMTALEDGTLCAIWEEVKTSKK
ncbi:MAG: hypothetical protein ACTSVE_02170 [Candidatus Helarchaeota archaeon]